MPTFPKGHNAYLMRCENAKKIAEVARETGGNLKVERKHARFLQDPVDLRGIPAVGRSISGAIFGTRPDAIADRY